MSARAACFRVQEVPVNWHEIDGSKLDVLSSTIQMARDILAIRLSYTLGIWKALPDTTPIIATRRTGTCSRCGNGAAWVPRGCRVPRAVTPHLHPPHIPPLSTHGACS
ncbi:hypothetical protein EON67_10520 [archaeon]|nr:MAG: hypothetical protein EON67_10520 [archaeon]